MGRNVDYDRGNVHARQYTASLHREVGVLEGDEAGEVVGVHADLAAHLAAGEMDRIEELGRLVNEGGKALLHADGRQPPCT